MNNSRSVPMTKDEALLLVQLVAANKVVTNKATNATNNQLKDEAWIDITKQFNSSVSSCPRTPVQLRLKWENLKKAARKRSSNIRLSQYKTGGGKPDYFPPDDTLDQVASILGATCDGYSVPFGGDADAGSETRKAVLSPIIYSSGGGNGIGGGKGFVADGDNVVDNGGGNHVVGDGVEFAGDGIQVVGDGVGEVVVLSTLPMSPHNVETTSTTPNNRKNLFGASRRSAAKVRDLKRKGEDEMVASNIKRNNAAANYYDKKSRLLDDKLDNKCTKCDKCDDNEKKFGELKLKLEKCVERIDQLELENKNFKIELEKLRNK